MIPIDRKAFALDCHNNGAQSGVSAHYLLAAAMLRSGIQEGAVEDRLGPYQYTQDRWNYQLQLLHDRFGRSFEKPNDISLWSRQVGLFATITSVFTYELSHRLKRWPEPAEQYLSELVGVDICVRGAESPDEPIEGLFPKNEVTDRLGELHAIVPDTVAGHTWRAVVDITSAALQKAYDQTSTLAAEVRQESRLSDDFLYEPYIVPTSSPRYTVEFVFATDRRRSGSAEPDIFGHERENLLTFGAMSINVPNDLHHKIGQLELPAEYRVFGITLYREDVNLDRHFVIKKAEVFDQHKFAQIVRSDTSRTAIVFVHGFNTTFSQAALRFAQIVWDMQFKGTPVLYSWPSRGGILNYFYDRDSALKSRPRFVELLQVLQSQGEIQTVHIIAHSMGNMIVLDALNQAAQQFSKSHLAELIFAAPDVSVDVFGDWIAGIRSIAKGLTLYASSQDWALVASRKASAGPRAGDIFSGEPVVLPGLDSIDVSSIGAELFGLNHNIFANNRSIIDDIGRICTDGKRPVSARSPQIRGMPPRSLTPRYWRYPK